MWKFKEFWPMRKKIWAWSRAKKSGMTDTSIHECFKPRCWKPLGHYLCTPEPGRLCCVISIQKGVKSGAFPLSQSIRKWRKFYLYPFIVPSQGLTVCASEDYVKISVFISDGQTSFNVIYVIKNVCDSAKAKHDGHTDGWTYKCTKWSLLDTLICWFTKMMVIHCKHNKVHGILGS